MKYFEDLVVGATASFGRYDVTREEVIDFATKYDPQPFHLDDEAAAKTHFGKLSASGWHTGAMAMRMCVENFKVEQFASLGSPGMDEVLWLKPVYPGDTLRCESILLEMRRSKSRRDIGLTKNKTTVFNQDDVAVMSFVSNALVAMRDPTADE